MSDTYEKNYLLDTHGKPYNRSLMFVLIIVGTFGAMLMQTSLGTAIPTLMHDFNIPMATAQKATTWFLLVNGIMVPISAYLATKFSTRMLYISAYGVLFLGMVVCYSAPLSNWWVFLLGRILQAAAVGLTMPLMQVALVNMFPAKKLGSIMGWAGIVIVLAPAVGPTFSGWSISHNLNLIFTVFDGSWRMVFFIPMVIIGIIFIMSLFVMRDVIPNKPVKLDIVSAILSTIGFGAFLWGFANVSRDGWGSVNNVIIPIVLGFLILIVFGIRQFKIDNPFLDLRVFKIKQFTLVTIALALGTMAMIGVEMMLPLYLQSVHGLSAFNSGLVLLPGSLMMAVVAPFSGNIYDRIGEKRLAVIGFMTLALGTIPFLFFNTSTPEHFVTLLYGIRMFGVGMIMMPLTTSAMYAVPTDEVAQATASNNTARQVASSIVVALLSSVAQNVISNHKPSASLKLTNPLDYANTTIEAMLKGYHASFAIGLAFAIIGLAVSLFLKKKVIVENSKKEKVGKA